LLLLVVAIAAAAPLFSCTLLSTPHLPVPVVFASVLLLHRLLSLFHLLACPLPLLSPSHLPAPVVSASVCPAADVAAVPAQLLSGYLLHHPPLR
jgi:hypothetical protein